MRRWASRAFFLEPNVTPCGGFQPLSGTTSPLYGTPSDGHIRPGGERTLLGHPGFVLSAVREERGDGGALLVGENNLGDGLPPGRLAGAKTDDVLLDLGPAVLQELL